MIFVRARARVALTQLNAALLHRDLRSRRASAFGALILVGVLGAICGLIGRAAGSDVAWWRPALLGWVTTTLVGVALGAPTGKVDWSRSLLACVGMVTLWECALLAVGQHFAVLQPYVAWVLRATLTAEAAGLVLAFALAVAAGLFDAPVGLCAGVFLMLASYTSFSLAWQLVAGVGAALAFAPARSGWTERLRRFAWAAAAISALALMNWSALHGAPGLLIIGAEAMASARMHSRWLVSGALAWLAWLALMAIGSPDLLTYTLSGAVAIVVFSRARDDRAQRRYSMGAAGEK